MADKYRLCIRLNDDFWYRYRTVYTRYDVTNENDLIKEYSTQDRINEWKQELIKQIQECENPFQVDLDDRDSYPVDERQIFEMPEGYKKPKVLKGYFRTTDFPIMAD